MQTGRTGFWRALGGLAGVSVIGALGLAAAGARAQEPAAPAQISERMEYIATEATCAEIVPIISNPMRPGLIDRKQFDVTTAVLPLFIYGYAMAEGLTYDAARFALIDACADAPDRPFAGFPAYRPDPAYWSQDMIDIWDRLHQ